MKGDFSKWAFQPSDNYTGVLHQQGRVLLDADWNAAQHIDGHWRETLARDAIGAAVLAVPAGSANSFKVLEAKVAGEGVELVLAPGRGWADGIYLYAPAPGTGLPASYLPPPFNAAGTSTADIGDGVRDAVVLEVWEESVSGYQVADLLEPALGGPDTTERAKACMALRLLRLGDEDDCSSVAGRVQDDPAGKGLLTVTSQPALVITGDCPLETGGGYTGLEHYLYRIEIGAPKAGEARFKWSQFNGGLVGKGRQVSLGKIHVEANNQAINHCGLTSFYLEALVKNALGCWEVVFGADATLSQDDELTLTTDFGVWPGAGPNDSVFFRLWNGTAAVADFPAGAGNPQPLKDGICLAFDAPAADLSNYRPGDYWTFPVRAAGLGSDTAWPSNAPPQGIQLHRVPLAILEWQADGTASYAAGQIDDCRKVFPPLTRQGVCCIYRVGDGRTSHGDFDSIQEAVDALPKAGGEVCLLPGVHEAGVVIRDRYNVTVRGCGIRTKVVPDRVRDTDPLFAVIDSEEVVLVSMDMATLGGGAIYIAGSEEGACRRVEVRDNRILACETGVRVEDARFVNIHHNRVRMLDKADAGVAIYVQADDALVERNELTVLPALRMPPLDVPGGGEVVHPTDPCARLKAVYVLRKYFAGYLNLVWTIHLPLIPIAPYKALSGIQVAVGAERVAIRENSITGGAGNGISLGGLFAAAEQPGTPGDEQHFVLTNASQAVFGKVVVPAGKTPQGIHLSFTNTETNQILQAVTNDQGGFSAPGPAGKYEVSVASGDYAIVKVDSIKLGMGVFYTLTLEAVQTQPDRSAAFLYDIQIERNNITHMGLSGIGVAPAPVDKPPVVNIKSINTALLVFLQRYGNPVIGLDIADNTIIACLQNPFDAELRALSTIRGQGGISLGMCEDLSITGNTIEKNGTSHLTPVCGIFVAYGEEARITGNRVVENGPLAAAAAGVDLQTGIRGGIVVVLASASSLVNLFAGGVATVSASQRPAARIHENLVDQPAGHALKLGAFGPVACTDNAFSSELSGPQPFERLAGTVFIFNIGGVQNVGGGSQIGKEDIANNAAAAAQPADNATNKPVLKRRVYADFSRPAITYRVMPGGYTQFNDNQVRTGAYNNSFCCQAIVSMDDVSYQTNQAYSYRPGALIANAFVFGSSLRASANRLSESGQDTTLMSLYSLAMRMNNSSFNQADHCIIATDMNTAMPEVQDGNQILHPGKLCRSFNMISDVMFKAQG